MTTRVSKLEPMEVSIRLRLSEDNDVAYRVFKVMEPEFKFKRGMVLTHLSNGDVVVVIKASDINSARSLINGVLKHIYLILSLQSGN
ncbi:CTAG/PCC1 family protein [Caldivirga sp. UBA161]|uniref:CTAG/PCC1 family protein n=1 Tax=Caldivirga sp. UBA161 TaxID=1915569 RepID=UPI0025C72C26|nr:CTAG/PCC1 family protein [Caldivirga sp. UBA161]